MAGKTKVRSEVVKISNPYTKPSIEKLEAVLTEGLYLEEEKEIARTFGFWVSPDSKSESSYTSSYKMFLPDGSMVNLTNTQGRIMRNILLYQWYSKKTEKVRLVEVDPTREAYEARTKD